MRQHNYTEVSNNICTQDITETPTQSNDYWDNTLHIMSCSVDAVSLLQPLQHTHTQHWTAWWSQDLCSKPEKRREGEDYVALLTVRWEHGYYFRTGTKVSDLCTVLGVHLSESSASSLLHHFHKLLVTELTIIWWTRIKRQRGSEGRWHTKHKNRREQAMEGHTDGEGIKQQKTEKRLLW